MSNSISEPRMLIDGVLTDGTSGASFENVNPATEAVRGTVADANHADMAAAISASRRAFNNSRPPSRASRRSCERS